MQLELPAARPTASTDSTSSTESSSSTWSSSSTESSVAPQAAERPSRMFGGGKTSKLKGPGGVIIPAPSNILPPAVPHNIVFVGCPLCLEPAIQPCVTRCGHVFCGPCITEALDAKANCPVCRVDAKSKQLRKIFLSSPASAPEA
ncbi:transporter [Ganoderma sinense ZZ0214-1]|uniref:Transporter n=1 Tax=Ganoderma sinense ZZ0214-1 TaxID=1077348 RepID=A0A2G8S1Y4_9APHY|nr:transporter [Ganoderma sinense ZZ0214-1]